MASLEHLDILLGNACELLIEASGEIRGIREIEKKANLMKVGRSIAEIWSIREEIYRVNPNLKRDFAVEIEQDKKRFESLNSLYRKAFELEKIAELDSANKLYQQLYDASRFGYFRLLSEAGMYRISVKNISNT